MYVHSPTYLHTYLYVMYIYMHKHICIYIGYALLLLSCSVMYDSVTPWTATHQAPLSMVFPRQEYWSG